MSDAAPGVRAVTARPIKSARICHIVAAVVVVVFVVVALLMRRDNAGAYFGHTDQVFTVLIGVLAAVALHLPSRPRLEADLDGVRMRGFGGDWRTVPWDAIVAVEFPSNVRFARVRLPAEETLAIYAIQRPDGEQAVAAMRGLRALFAATHPDPARPE